MQLVNTTERKLSVFSGNISCHSKATNCKIVQIDFGLKPKLLIKLLLNFAFLAGLGFKPNL